MGNKGYYVINLNMTLNNLEMILNQSMRINIPQELGLKKIPKEIRTMLINCMNCVHLHFRPKNFIILGV